MSVEIADKGNQKYAYFYAGRQKKIYLGNVTDKNEPKINTEKVLEALDYLDEKNIHYQDVENQLISFLPPDKKDQYLSKRIQELYKIAESHVSSLSDPKLKRQYSGDRTKVRPLTEKESMMQDPIQFHKDASRNKHAQATLEITRRILLEIFRFKKVSRKILNSRIPEKHLEDKIEMLIETGMIEEVKLLKSSYIKLTERGNEFVKEFERFLKSVEKPGIEMRQAKNKF